jgi:benzylsuccinate CoA-transferase BbsF subunit
MKNVFDGLKVLEFAWILAGPLTSGYLAAHGATIVRIESMQQPDMLRTSPPFKDGIPGINRSGGYGGVNANKYSMALDLNNPASMPVVKRLVEWADIVSENYSPGRMEKWGLGYDELKKIKPDIIMIRNSNQGQTGPHASRRGFGILLTSQIGFNSVTGWPDRGPNSSYIGYTDFIAPRFAATALIAALLHRKKTGHGQCLDISQSEAALQFMSPVFLDYCVNGRKEGRTGNASPYAAPHAAYRCRGDDRWCAISVSSDQEWESFCNVIQHPEWTLDPKFSTLRMRKQNEDELNQLVEQWSVNIEAEQVMRLMQSAGVPAGVVQNGRDLFNDPQLKSRTHTWNMEHEELGNYPFSALSIKLSKTPQEARMPSPCLGQHTQMVCQEFLGMSDEEFVELLNKGVFE